MIKDDLMEYIISINENTSDINIDRCNISTYGILNNKSIDILKEGFYNNINPIQEANDILTKLQNKNKKIMIKMEKDNNKYLEKYEKKALENNPVGLKMKEFYIPKDKWIKFFHAEKSKASKIKSKKDFDKMLQSVTTSYNTEKSKSKGNLNIVFDIKKDYTITKADIKNAISTLKKCPKQLNYVSNQLANRIKVNQETIQKINNDKKLSADQKDIKIYQWNYENNMWGSELILMSDQLLNIQKQARKVLVKAAKYNPRKIKESNEFLENVEFLLDEQFNSELEYVYHLDESNIQLEAGEFDNLIASLSRNSKKFLDKYEQDALNSDLKDCKLSVYYEAKDLTKIFKDAIAKVSKDFKVENTKSNKKELMKKYRGNIISYIYFGQLNGHEYKNIKKDFKSNDKNLFIKKVDYKINKNDVKDAISFINNFDKVIKKNNLELRSENIKIAKEIEAHSLMTNLPFDDYKDSIIQGINHEYKIAKTKILKKQYKQSKLIILKAAKCAVKENAYLLYESDDIIKRLTDLNI